MFYCYTGDSYKIKEKIKSFNLPVIYVDNIKDIYDSLFTNNLFDDYCCYVSIDDNTVDTKMIKQIEPLKHIVVCQYTKINKRTKLGQLAETFEPYTLKEIVDKINYPEAEKLAKLCNLDMTFINIELNKIKNSDYDLFELNMIGDNSLVLDDYCKLYSNAFMNKDLKKLFYLNSLHIIQSSWLLVTAYVYNTAKSIFIAKQGGYTVNYIYKQCPITVEEAYKTMTVLYRLNKELKQGLINPDVVLDIFILEVLK